MHKEENTALAQKSTEEKSDFGRIIEWLQIEYEEAKENERMLREIANAIKPMEEEPIKEEVEKALPNGLVDLLWQKIYQIQKINRETNKIIRHLGETFWF